MGARSLSVEPGLEASMCVCTVAPIPRSQQNGETLQTVQWPSILLLLVPGRRPLYQGNHNWAVTALQLGAVTGLLLGEPKREVGGRSCQLLRRVEQGGAGSRDGHVTPQHYRTVVGHPIHGLVVT
eukprot:2696592-Rhodomonas_salina.1